MEIIGSLNALGIVFCVLAVAIPAQAAIRSRQHRIAGLGNIVITMALAALRPIVLVERLFVFAALEQTCIRGVADAATFGDLGNAWWTGRMIAMAGIAAGRSKITAFQ